MHQEALSPSGSAKRDVWSIVALAVVLIIVEVAAALFNRSMPGMTIFAHLIVFLLLVVFLVTFYYKRLLGYRYTLYTDEQSEDTPPRGTFTAESTIGDNGHLIALITPDMMRTLSDYEPGAEELMGLKSCDKATRLKKDTSTVLVYESCGKRYGLMMHPSDELKALIRDIIRENTEE